MRLAVSNRMMIHIHMEVLMKKGIHALAVLAFAGLTAIAVPPVHAKPSGMTGQIKKVSSQYFMMRSASGHDNLIMTSKSTRYSPTGYGMSQMTVGQKVWVTASKSPKGKYMASTVTNMGGWNMGMMTMEVSSVSSNSFGVDMMMGGGMMGNDQDMTVTVTNSTVWSPSGYGLSSMQTGDWVQIFGTMTGWYTMEATSVTMSDDDGGGCGDGGMGMGGH